VGNSCNLSFQNNPAQKEGCYNRSEMRVQSFPPVLCSEPKVLVLGSMPGRRSLEMHQYYAHPRNKFWQIMGTLCNSRPEIPYSERIAALQNRRIALWDVLQACDRDGSLDSNIRQESEIANDLPGLLTDYPTILAIGFNGAKAGMAFRRLVQPFLNAQIIERLELFPLPSTSPANAAIPYEEKVKQWCVLEQYL
jgi:TDG/mug DNA glycosylase family protein